MTIEELFVVKYKELEEENKKLNKYIEEQKERIIKYQELVKVLRRRQFGFDWDKKFFRGWFLDEDEVYLFEFFGIINKYKNTEENKDE